MTLEETDNKKPPVMRGKGGARVGTAGVTLTKGSAGQWGSLPGLGPAQGRSIPGASLSQFPRERLRDGCPGRDPPPPQGPEGRNCPPGDPCSPRELPLVAGGGHGLHHQPGSRHQGGYWHEASPERSAKQAQATPPSYLIARGHGRHHTRQNPNALMVSDTTTCTFGLKSHTFSSEEMTPAYLDASNTGRGQGQAALPDAALWAKPASLVASPTPTPTAPCPPRHPAENVPPEASESLPLERPWPLQHRLDLSPAQSDLEPSVWRPCWAVEPDLTQDGPSSGAGSSCPATPDPHAPSPGPQLHLPLSRCLGRYTEQTLLTWGPLTATPQPTGPGPG